MMTTIRLAALFCLAVTTACADGPLPDAAGGFAGIDWHLRALNGTVTAPGVTFRIDAEGSVSGQAPCNRYFGTNGAVAPALRLDKLAATRMACDRLAEEDAYFQALAGANALILQDGHLMLTGPAGARLEFVRDLSGTVCRTCKEG